VQGFFRTVAICIVAALAGGSTARAQRDPQTAILEAAGFKALDAGDARRAADAFRTALTHDPSNAVLHLGAGAAAFLERRDADAKAELEKALALDPALGEARRILGQVLYRLGDLLGAIRTYEALAGEHPDERTSAALDRWRRELELNGRMQLAVGNHFTIAFEGPQDALLAERALDALDRAYWRIGQIMGVYPVNPIPVVLYTNEQFRDITRAPMWAAGSYDGVIRVPMRGALAKQSELDRVLSHEFTHALVRTLAPRGVPTWLNEGLAAALEGDSIEWAGARIARGGGTLPLSQLQTSFARFGGRDADLAYATSAVTVRRLLDEADGFAVANLLRDLGEGVDFDAAFLHRIQQPFSEFARTLTP
jgi:tetratricopeptide (TPR) repeat protein